MKATILRGLSGSGKSTYAEECVENNPVTFEVNRDELRRIELNVPYDENLWKVYSKFNNKVEDRVSERIRDDVLYYAECKYNIIDSDINISQKRLRSKIEFYESLGYEVEVILLDEDVYECIDRDSKRRDSVGSKVIFKQYLKLKECERDKDRNGAWKDRSKRNCVVADLDGTLARNVTRDIYDYTKVYEDQAREEVVCMVKAVAEKYDADIIFCSGREDKGSCFYSTLKWLQEIAGFGLFFTLYMREENDSRKDSMVKKEFLDCIREEYNIVAWFDDRPQVCDMLNDNGVNVISVADQRLRF